MSFLSLQTQTLTRFYGPTSNGIDQENYSVDTYTCRWQNSIERFESASGEAWDSKAIIYSEEDFDLDDWCYLGLTSETDPRNLDDAYRVKLKYYSQNPTNSIQFFKYILG